MSRQHQLEVINREGWRRTFLLEKIRTLIGNNSAHNNDIDLSQEDGDPDTAPWRVQLIFTTSNGMRCQLINLAEQEVFYGPTVETINQSLSSRAVTDLADRYAFRLGEFTLVLRLAHAIKADDNATNSDDTDPIGEKNIGLRFVEMSSNELEPGKSLEGSVIVQNLGEKSGVQFNLTLEGLDAGYYSISRGPVVASGSEKAVSFQLHHEGKIPLAGNRRITIRATAPKDYPNEEVSDSAEIKVLPYYNHSVTILSPDELESPPPP